jgi:hypothetical protein
MTTTLNATTSNGLVVTPDNSGNVLLQYNGQGAPAFSVYSSTSPTVSNNTATKIPFNTKVFDTNTNFDTTNNRFTPTVAGYYQINLSYLVTGTSGRNYEIIGSIYKNGSVYLNTYISVTITNGTSMSRNISAVVYLNGSTDYVEGYTQHYDYTATSTMTLYSGSDKNNFSGSLLRGA